MSEKVFSQIQTPGIADGLRDNSIGLTGSEIGYLLSVARSPDPDPTQCAPKHE